MGRHKKGGRPKGSGKYNEIIIGKIEEGLKNDFTIHEACLWAGINDDTYYDWCKNKKGFSDRMDRAKAFLFFAAKNNIAQAVIKNKDTDSSRWILKTRQKETYSERQETTGKDGGPIQTEQADLDKQLDVLNKTLEVWRHKRSTKS